VIVEVGDCLDKEVITPLIKCIHEDINSVNYFGNQVILDTSFQLAVVEEDFGDLVDIACS
jgi:hypothetical protein